MNAGGGRLLVLGLALAIVLALLWTRLPAPKPESHVVSASGGATVSIPPPPSATELRAASPAFVSLTPEALARVSVALDNLPGPCVPCLEPQPVPFSRCALERPKGCENLSHLLDRVARLAAGGAKEGVLLEAVSYGDAWIPGVDATGTGPVPVELWIDLGSPFLGRTLELLQALRTAEPETRNLRLHPWVPPRKSAALARAAWAADQQAALLPFADAVLARGKAASDKDVRAWSDADLQVLAGKVPGLDGRRFAADLARAADPVEEAQREATRVGVRASPTWFVAGYRARGLQSIDTLRHLIERERVDRPAAGAP